MMIPTEVYLSDEHGPLQGTCIEQGERLLFEREGDETKLYRLTDEEWAQIETPPVTTADFADLAALHRVMKSRGPVTVLRG